MDVSIPEKDYFRIGEASKILGVEPYVIRYWESEFKSVRPVRAKSNQRLYRRKDVQELLLIKSLLYNERFTISGAKKQLKKMKRETGQESGQSPGQSPSRSDDAPEQMTLLQIRSELLQIRELVSRKEF